MFSNKPILFFFDVSAQEFKLSNSLTNNEAPPPKFLITIIVRGSLKSGEL